IAHAPADEAALLEVVEGGREVPARARDGGERAERARLAAEIAHPLGDAEGVGEVALRRVAVAAAQADVAGLQLGEHAMAVVAERACHGLARRTRGERLVELATPRMDAGGGDVDAGEEREILDRLRSRARGLELLSRLVVARQREGAFALAEDCARLEPL